MRIKRIFAANTREALRKVREQHGPDAVVISSRNVDGGVEVISAVDYDERAVQAAARAQDPRAAEIPPLEGAAGPRPSEPDTEPASGAEPGSEATAPGGPEAGAGEADEAARAREAALERLRRLRAGGAADDALPRRGGSESRTGRAQRGDGAVSRGRRLRAEDLLGVSGSRVDLRVGGSEEDEELFDTLSREHQEAERRRSRPVGGMSAGGPAPSGSADGEAPRQGPARPQGAGSPAAAEQPAARRRSAEAAEEPESMREMREELRTLRSLFENQLSVLEWERMGRRHPARATVHKRLADLGLGSDVSRRLAEHIDGDEEPDAALRKALALVARHLPVADDEIVSRGGVVALVGPTGVGKTTTVAKLAARYALHHGREQVALVSTDNYRVGAQDQLLTYARILDVPVYTATNRHELRSLVDDLMGRGLVLIDTVGMSQRDVRLAEQFKTLGSAQGLVRTYLVLSAATQLSTLTESVSAFAGAEPVGCIFTKVDEATTLGGALTCALRTRLPVSYLGVGQRVPEDLQAAKGENLVHRACALLDEEGSQEPDEEALALSLGGGAHVPE